jgi:hypothetical protein
MASAITGTGQLAGAPTAYSGSNSSLNQAIQTIWSKEILVPGNANSSLRTVRC